MIISQSCLASFARIAYGVIFLASVMLDVKSRDELFALMKKKNVKLPSLCFCGAVTWKCVTAIALIANVYTFWAAILLATYIFIANFIFNNFWTAPAKQINFSMAMFLTHFATCIGLLAIAANNIPG